MNEGDLGKISEISRPSVLFREEQLPRFTERDATRHGTSWAETKCSDLFTVNSRVDLLGPGNL